jgi:hypothetical protein
MPFHTPPMVMTCGHRVAHTNKHHNDPSIFFFLTLELSIFDFPWHQNGQRGLLYRQSYLDNHVVASLITTSMLHITI